MVFIKLKPYKQYPVASRGNQNLTVKIFYPYKITAKVRKVAYQIRLPAEV